MRESFENSSEDRTFIVFKENMSEVEVGRITNYLKQNRFFSSFTGCMHLLSEQQDHLMPCYVSQSFGIAHCITNTACEVKLAAN